jgi:hypothetical protein
MAQAVVIYDPLNGKYWYDYGDGRYSRDYKGGLAGAKSLARKRGVLVYHRGTGKYVAQGAAVRKPAIKRKRSSGYLSNLNRLQKPWWA